MVASINDDALQLVFEEFARGEPWKWPDAVYDADMARRPFLLAAVSHRWRSLALDTPAIWTYFGFPMDSRMYPKHKERLRVLVAASKSAPIDLIASVGIPIDSETDEPIEDNPGAEVFSTLIDLGPRWRHARFVAPCDDATVLFRQALAGPLPNLLSLSVISDITWANLAISATFGKVLCRHQISYPFNLNRRAVALPGSFIALCEWEIHLECSVRTQLQYSERSLPS